MQVYIQVANQWQFFVDSGVWNVSTTIYARYVTFNCIMRELTIK